MNQEITDQEIVIEDEMEMDQVIVASEQEDSDDDRNVYFEFFRH